MSFDERTEPLRGPGRKTPLAARVRVEGAEATPAETVLDAGRLVIGSSPGCDIVVTDKAVSRRHVELGLVAEGVVVRDLGSRNGTFFHGHRVESMTLALGGRLSIGSAEIRIDADRGSLEAAPLGPGDSYRGIVGRAEATKKLFAVLTRLEGSLATVLVEGESGVGKERVAQALHDGSARSTGPLVTVNCGALPRDLVASELFGHRRGAFSGALDARKGAFVSAHQGTLFLDEVGELPLDLQPMLLRALELGEVRALGDDQAKRVDVRVVAATNRDLEAQVREGRFRQDLFYRLAVVRLAVPPLRERPLDIAPLAQHFARGAGLDPLSASIVEELESRPWPGNARELRNAIVAYSALGSLPTRPPAASPDLVQMVAGSVDLRRPFAAQKEALIDAFAASYLEALMKHTGGNQSEAARVAGLNRNHLARLLTRYGLR